MKTAEALLVLIAALKLLGVASVASVSWPLVFVGYMGLKALKLAFIYTLVTVGLVE